MTASTKPRASRLKKAASVAEQPEPAYIPSYDEPLTFAELSESGKARALRDLQTAKEFYLNCLFYAHKPNPMTAENRRMTVAEALRRFGGQAAYCGQSELAERAAAAVWKLKKNELTIADLVEDAL